MENRSPRTNEKEYVVFTDNPDAGNNPTLNGSPAGSRVDVDVTAFW